MDTYGDFFKELGPAQEKITRVIREEEAQFNKTIAQGMKVFEKKAAQLKANGKKELSGADAFFLASSMGFPLDLTEIMCDQRGMTVRSQSHSHFDLFFPFFLFPYFSLCLLPLFRPSV